MDSPDSVLAGINGSLQDGWQAKLNQNGRLFYLDHNSRASRWVPPPTCWLPKADLPYGWEEAVDKNGKCYYINHVTCTTTREDPYDVEDVPPVEREVTLLRDQALGFGFIAGSEKPVVVRSVTEGGPSVGKLMPGDMVLRLNGEDVKMKDGPYIIERIRQSSETIRLTVVQPYIDKTGLKSSFLSATKKQKLKSKPSKVRFADNVKAAAVAPGKSPPSLVYLPSVLKVYLENGQTKSFKYDNKTSVKEVLKNLKEKLNLRSIEYFSLVVQNMEDTARPNKFSILQEDETLTQIASRPGSQDWKCLLRVTFVPQDAYDLLSKDSKAFEYFYLQCCNDVINERFTGELDTDKAVRLAALEIQQHFLNSKQTARVSLKALEKEDGLERFLPPSIAKKMKTKELRRLLSQHIKQSHSLCAPGQKHLTELQAKLHYLKIVCDLRSFGGRFFTGTMVPNVESDNMSDYHCTVLVGPKCGITQIISMINNTTSLLADFSQLTDIQLCPALVDGDCLRVELHVKNEKPVVLLLTHDDAYDMVTLVNGYYRLFVDVNRSLLPQHYSHSIETEAPTYCGKHRVISADWNYPNDLVSELIPGEGEVGGQTEWGVSRGGEGEYIVDLSVGPPPYEEDVAYINRLKAQGRFHPLEAAGGQPDGAVMSFTIMEEGEEEEDTESYHDNNILHRNANNSLDTSIISKSASETSTISSLSDKSLGLTRLSDMVEDMFDDIQTPKSETGEDNLQPQENRLDMRIDGSDDRKVFSETNEETDKMPRRKSLTKHFDVSDSVAMHSPINERKNQGQVKLLHYFIYNDDSVIPVGEISPILQEDDNSDRGEENVWSTSSASAASNPKVRLVVQDSVTLAHSRNIAKGDTSVSIDSQDENEKDSRAESFRNLSYSSSSVDSDIEDLTQNSFVDSPDREDSLCLRTKPEIHALDLSVVYTGETEDDDPVDIPPTSASPVPVSIIDLPSPDAEEEKSDEAHGIQLAALDAINISLNNRDELLRRDPECESDSGNETISSEIIDNGVSDESGLSHSPSDYFSMVGGHRAPSRVEPVDRDPTPTPDLSEENPPNLISSCFGSDTDSISTLHGSSPNLSAFEGSEKASDTLESQLDGKTYDDNIDELIASLIISPPSLEPGDLDEELLNAVLPPPPISDFDIGVIESLIVPPPPMSPATSPPVSSPKTPTKVPRVNDNNYSTTVMIKLKGGQAFGKEITALELELPKGQHDTLNTASASPKENSPIRAPKGNNPIRIPQKGSSVRALKGDSPIRTLKADSPIRAPKEDSPIRASKEDSSIRDHKEDNPVGALKGDSPIRAPKGDSSIRSPEEDSPISALKADSPIRAPKEDSPIRTPKEDNPIRAPKEDSSFRDPKEDSPFRDPKEDNPIRALKDYGLIRDTEEDSPIRQQNATTSEKKTPSPVKSRPYSPAKVPASPSKGEPHPSSTSSRRPRKISSCMMSSSQDSGFCQLGPGDFDPTVSVAAGVALDEFSIHEIAAGHGRNEDLSRSDITSKEKEHFSEHASSDSDLKDEETSTGGSRGNEDDSVDGDEFGAVETLKALSDSMLAGLDKVGLEFEKSSPSLEALIETTPAQSNTEVKPAVIKAAPKVPLKPAIRQNVAQQDSVDSLTGGDFDTIGHPAISETKKTSPSAPEPPPRKRYSPGLFKKIYQFETGKAIEVEGNTNVVQRSSSMKAMIKTVSPDYTNGKCLTQSVETVKTVKRSTSVALRKPLTHSNTISLPVEDEEESYSASRRGEDVNLGPSNMDSVEMRPTMNGKTALGPRLSGDIELRHVTEDIRPTMRSNTFSAGIIQDCKKPVRKAPPPPSPKPLKLKESPSSEKPPTSKEKRSFRNTVSLSSPSSIAKLLSPTRSLSFLRGAKPFSRTSTKADEPVQLSSTPKEKKDSRRPRPLRAFRSLSRKDSYDVSMFDHKKDRSGEPSFRESQNLRSVGGLQRPSSLNLGDTADESEAVQLKSAASRPVSLFETRARSEELDDVPASTHPPLRQSQSLSRATSRPVSYPSSPQKYPCPGSIHASLPKRPPPPRPNNPPASPRKAMYPSDDSLSSSSSEVLSSPIPLPSPSGYDQDSTDSDDFSSPPPLPVSLPPVKSRPRALPEHFIPPPSFTSPNSSDSLDSDGADDSYTVELESKEYRGKDSIPEALGDIQLLISELQTCILAEESTPSLRQFKLSKESLVSEVREFTSNTKMLVSSAGQSEDLLVRSVNSSMHTLARLCSDAQQMMKAMVSVLQATNLGNKTKEVASNFSNTVSAAAEAHGKNLNDPKMQLLLRQAQTMAAILAALMRTLRMLQS